APSGSFGAGAGFVRGECPDGRRRPPSRPRPPSAPLGSFGDDRWVRSGGVPGLPLGSFGAGGRGRSARGGGATTAPRGRVGSVGGRRSRAFGAGRWVRSGRAPGVLMGPFGAPGLGSFGEVARRVPGGSGGRVDRRAGATGCPQPVRGGHGQSARVEDNPWHPL